MSSQRQITYKYDALDRLVEARHSDGTVVLYTYDPAGNRTAAIVTPPAVAAATRAVAACDGVPASLDGDAG